MRLDVAKFLEDLTGKHARGYAELIGEMLAATATGDRVAMRRTREQFGELVRDTMGTAEVLGASITLQEAAKTMSGTPTSAILQADRRRMAAFAEQPTQSILPRVTFEESVQDMVDRTPVTIRNAAERNAQAIAKIYGRQNAVAFAHSAEAAVTKRAQDLIAEMMREGTPEVDAGRRLVMGVDEVRKRTKKWADGYARMAFRTNVNTAVTAGRFRVLKDPAIRKVLPAIEFYSVGDGDTRHNHDLADEVVMQGDDTRWNKVAPPLGYNCRCKVRGVNALELQRRGMIDDRGNFIKQRLPPGAGPDEGFRHGRVDLGIPGGLG